MNDIRGQLDKIRYYLKNEFYDVAIKESSLIFEVVLRKTYAQAVAELPLEQRNELFEAEKQIGGQNVSYLQFGFGKLVALFNRCKLLDKWSKMRGENLGILRSISLESIVELRNNLTHVGGGANVQGHTARLVYECLMNWLAFLGYAELPHTADNAFKPAASVPAKEEDSHKEHLTEKIKSTYTPATGVEAKRLIVQARLADEIDKQSFEFALRQIGKVGDIYGLDVGAATGYVTESRFKAEYGFAKVVGIDKEASVLKPDHDYFIYREINAESDDFEEQMETLMTEQGIESFDIVYMSFSLHHLTNPIKFLRRVRKLMSTGGIIILKGVDDDAQLAFGDHDLVRTIVDNFLKLEGISDRLHARKFYGQLKSAGFGDVTMKYQVTNTVGLSADEKEEIFNYYFGFRKYYSRRLIEKYPENEEYAKMHEKLVSDLEELEEIFLKPDLYYHVLLFCAIGVK